MANVAPFRALHYNPHKVDLTDVVTPPYDVISPEEATKLMSRSPYNFAHVILPQSPDEDYSRSATLLAKWRELGILQEDASPGYYFYQQRFTLNGVKHTRRTLMCAVQLVDFSEGVIRPHENTFGKYKEDRFRILSKTRCNLSHVFGMVKDPMGHLDVHYERFLYHPPLLTGHTDDGVEHAVWKMEPDKGQTITQFFADKPIYIVDGHHRYESALKYARDLGVLGNPSHPAAYMLFAIANVYDPALVVLPTHRFVHGLENTEKLNLEHIESVFDMLRLSVADLKRFTSKPPPVPSFALYLQNDLYLLTPKHWHAEEGNWGKSLTRLSVAWSDFKFLKEFCGIDDTNRAEKVTYYKDIDSAWEKRASANCILFHAPPAIEEVTHVADEKRFMPQKSTFFYPKLAAGFVVRAIA